MHSAAAGDGARAGARGASRISASTRSRSACSARAEVTLRSRSVLEELPPGTPVVVDPVMVAESGARCSTTTPRRALFAEILPRASVLTPNLPRRACWPGEPRGSRQHAGRRGARRSLGRCSRSGPQSWCSPAGIARSAVDLFLDQRGRSGGRDPGRAPPRRRGARLRLHALLGARRAARARAHAAAGGAHRLARSPARPSPRASATSARGGGPVDVLDLARRRRTERTLTDARRVCHNRWR